jgi:hypothetical protein
VPTLHREAGYSFKFRASDGSERPHVHVIGNGGRAKVWLVPSLEVENTRGYDVKQMGRILEITKDHRDEWLDAWRSSFGR